jgi:L-fuculose-phosphate aldolase
VTTSLRARTAIIARELHARGWVANHDGNLTVRDGARYLATPTATSKRLVGDRDLVELDAAGKVVGPGKVFGEIGLHLAVYARRPDVGAVVHAHPPHATAIACARGGVTDHAIARPFIAEAVVSLGPVIPRLPFAAPGDPSAAALAPWCEEVDAVLLGGHGAIAWGKDAETAFLRLELVEHLARIALAALPLGGPEPLPAAAIPPLLAARAKAGIGRAADRALALADDLQRRPPDGGGAPARAPAGTAARPVIACAPAPHSSTVTTASAPPTGSADLATIVRDEIVRALRGS